MYTEGIIFVKEESAWLYVFSHHGPYSSLPIVLSESVDYLAAELECRFSDLHHDQFIGVFGVHFEFARMSWVIPDCRIGVTDSAALWIFGKSERRLALIDDWTRPPFPVRKNEKTP